MSPNTNTNISWDPSRLRLDQDGVRRLQGGTRCGRRASPIRGKFIAGPIDVSWVVQASRLGGKALIVGLALWYLKKLRQADTFIVSNLMLQEWDVQPDAKTRALRKLEKAGLIRIERRGKRSPQVTLVGENRFEGGKVAAVENLGQPRAITGPSNRETPGKE
jgi:DNA-binding transcriptional ArsR family regulator